MWENSLTVGAFSGLMYGSPNSPSSNVAKVQYPSVLLITRFLPSLDLYNIVWENTYVEKNYLND